MRRMGFIACIAILLVLTACGGGGGGSTTSTVASSTGGINGTGGALSITNTSLPSGLTGKSYSATITTSGGTGHLTFSTVPGSFFPQGLSLNSSTGQITGTAGSGAVFGDVTFQVTDSGSPQQKAEKTLRMTINWSLSVTVNLTFPATMHANVPYSIPFYGDSSNGNVTWSVASGQLPPGMSLSGTNATQATFAGTPTQPGTYTFTVQLVDSSTPPQTATKTVTFNVDNKFAIATTSLPVPYQGDAYSQTITAVNGTPPYHWSLNFYYQFFKIDPNTGVLSGTAGSGNYCLPVTVTDSSTPAQTATQTYCMDILPRLQVTSSPLQDAHVGTSYYGSMYHVGGQGNLNWSIVSGSLPPGISLLPAYGVLSGIPTQTGTYNFTVQLQDSSTPPQTAQGQFSINVLAPVLQLQQSLPARIPVNVAFDGAVVATGGTQPVTWKLNFGSLPTGLSLDTGTGRISGTPTANGSYAFNVAATDSSSPQQSAYQQYSMTVGPALGRNDAVTNATPLANGGFSASISPLVDPVDGTTLNPDTDYYKITGAGGATIRINVYAYTPNYPSGGVLDPVLELVDANGARLSACRQPGDTTSDFTSSCLNDDIVPGTNRNSQLEYLVPGTSDQKTDIYAHVFDWRGDARPDMGYSINVSGAYVPIVFAKPSLPPAVQNASYGIQLSATGGVGVLTGSITSGQLPPGVNFQAGTSIPSQNGGSSTWYAYLNGTPTSIGDYQFTVTVTDQAVPQQTLNQQFVIHVYNPLVLNNVPDQTLKVGQTATYQASATGGATPYAWQIISGGWPGATVNANTGLLTFQPTAAGQFVFYISVYSVDMPSASANQRVTVTVNP